jgi:transcription antitermination protein NusB
MKDDEALKNPRVIVIQKLYSYFLNKDNQIIFPKHRYRKFIKDVVHGSIERNELIEKSIKENLKDDINENKTELIIKIMIIAAIYEFMYMHKTPINVIISEYLKVSDYFISNSQKSFLNAILDKASKFNRINDE